MRNSRCQNNSLLGKSRKAGKKYRKAGVQRNWQAIPASGLVPRH